MKKGTFMIVVFAAILTYSCNEKNQKSVEVKKVDDNPTMVTTGLDVKVDNKIDPICEMETAGYLSDTIHYHGKVFGFCSKGCKETFAKNPEKYVFKMGN